MNEASEQTSTKIGVTSGTKTQVGLSLLVPLRMIRTAGGRKAYLAPYGTALWAAMVWLLLRGVALVTDCR